MTTIDMFALPEPEPCCGACVHLNRSTSKWIGFCSPMGWRDADSKPCMMYFGKAQLRAATARRPA